MYNYYELVQAVNRLITVVQELDSYLRSVLTPILYVLVFAFLLKIGFTCLRGYKL